MSTTDRLVARRVLTSAAWIAILVITAIVQFIRAAPLDGGLFVALALALVVDASGLLPAGGALPRPRSVLVLIGTLGAAVLLTLTPRHGIVDAIVVIAAGIVAAPLAWRSVAPAVDRGGDATPRADERELRRTAILWASAGIVTCLWELTSFVLGRVLPEQKAEHPAISDLLDPALDQLWMRALFVIGWLALGVGLLLRGGRR